MGSEEGRLIGLTDDQGEGFKKGHRSEGEDVEGRRL